MILARLDLLATQCDEIKKLINSKGVNVKLYNRAAPDFLIRIDGQRSKIAKQRSRVDTGGFSETSWSTLYDCEYDCSRLFGECLAFLQAARARGQDVDVDLCEIADALIDELTETLTNIKWNRFTVLSTEEFFSDFAQIIRLRFPFRGIWDLPISAHEFGHFVATELNLASPDGSHSLPFQEYKSDFKKQYADRGDEWMFYIEEYFADVFATYVLGPAYACTCLLLRFDPSSAHSERDKRHPSYANRAHAISQTLLRMNNEKDSKGDFKLPVDTLTGFWNAALESTGQKAAVIDEAQVGSFVSTFYEMLKSGAPRARFNRWNVAKSLSPWLKASVTPSNVTAADFRISDLLNTAWLYKLEPDVDSDHLSNRVIRLCRLRTDVI
jgi:hypothetical protein